MAAWELERLEGEEDTDRTDTETYYICGEDTVANSILGTEPNYTLASDPGL